VSAKPPQLFRFSQIELPWALGPPDGRYLLRAPGSAPDGPAAHVLVLATLGAPERRRRVGQRRQLKAEPEPEPSPVSTGRATVVDVGEPLQGPEAGRQWLGRAGEEQLAADLAVLNRALHAFRLVIADPHLHTVSRHQALVARVGFGAGEQVADGLWTDARELLASSPRTTRAKVLEPQARLAAILNGREQPLACEELTLRARLDLDAGRDREAALQVLIALDAALAELAIDPTAPLLRERLSELREQRDGVALAAQAALGGPLPAADLHAVTFALSRIEAALRARAVASS
jgi:hypothetical protein